MRIQALIAFCVIAYTEARRGAPVPEPKKSSWGVTHPTYGWGFQMEPTKDEKEVKEVKAGMSGWGYLSASFLE